METTGAPAPADTAPVSEAEPSVGVEDVSSPSDGAQNARERVNRLLEEYEESQAQRAAEKQKEPAPEPEGLRDGESWDSVYKSSTPEQQRALASLRADYTRKTQELARQRRAIEAQNKAFADSGILESLKGQSGEMPADFDPFNPEHVKAAIQAQVALKLKELVEPLHHQQKANEASARYQDFKEKHPDLLSDPAVKEGVMKALKKDESLTLETAYWAVKGHLAHAAKEKETARQTVRRRAQQRAAGVPSTGRRPSGGHTISPEIKEGKAWDIYNRLLSQRDSTNR